VPEENNSVDRFRTSTDTRTLLEKYSLFWDVAPRHWVNGVDVSGLLHFFGNLGHQSPSDTVLIRDEQRPQMHRYESQKTRKDIEICVSIRELNRSRPLGNMYKKSRAGQHF
jgi:hypothetical protein